MRFFRRRQKRLTGRFKKWRKPAVIGFGTLVALFITANAVMWFAYRERVLPNYSVGNVDVGNVSFDKLGGRLTPERLLPENIELVKGKTKQQAKTAGLGLRVDVAESAQRLKDQRSFLPLLSLVRQRTVPVSLHVDDQIFVAAAEKLKKSFKKEPAQKRITFARGNFEIAPAANGYALDVLSLKSQLVAGAKQGRASVQVPITAVKPKEGRGDLDKELERLRQELEVEVVFRHNDQTFKPTQADMGKWYVQRGQTMEVSEERVRAYVQSLAADLYNVRDAAAATVYALNTKRGTTFVLDSTPNSVRYTYCIGTRGVSSSYLSGFAAKVAATLADPRGWNAGGRVVFSRVDSGCQFNIWLSAPSQMTSFGGLCDPVWSCRSGRNVVINFDRWQGATDAWNNAGGGLEDYRVMVTNHEVGHWLGFGHSGCPGPGQSAPVMMQQSIDLRGCKFNPWPTGDELSRL